MSRHRNIRSLNYADEYDDFNNVIGSLTDEPECISPTDANHYLFDRARGQSSLDTFLSKNDDIQEQDEDEELEFDGKHRRDSENFQLPELNDYDKGRLLSCMEEIRNIIGDSHSDKRLADTIILNNYDFTKALDMLLNDTAATTTAQLSKRQKIAEVEKDFDKIALSDKKVSAEETAPKFESLSDLGKYQLGKNNVPSSSKQFKLPLLGGFTAKSSETTSNSFSSLSDYANAQLKSYTQSESNKKPSLSSIPQNPLNLSSFKPNFTIPKIFPSKNEPLSEKLANLEIKSDPPKVLIDLKSALVPEIEQKKISKVPKPIVKQEAENFIPQFVDSSDVLNVSVKDLCLDDCCERVTLSQMKSRYKNCSPGKWGPVGRIIKLKFKRKFPKVYHGYEPKHSIIRFAFDTPSPDDKILAHLNKNKK